eukprot:Pgem_evm1s9348
MGFGREEGFKVYIGGLPMDNIITQQRLSEVFEKYGPLNDVWVAQQPPGFAYVYYTDERDAQDAIDKLNDTELEGRRICNYLFV